MYEDIKEYLNWYDTRKDQQFQKDAPVIGLVLQRSHLVTGDEGHYAVRARAPRFPAPARPPACGLLRLRVERPPRSSPTGGAHQPLACCCCPVSQQRGRAAVATQRVDPPPSALRSPPRPLAALPSLRASSWSSRRRAPR